MFSTLNIDNQMHRTKLLISTRNLPIRNLNVLKCGATRVRNVMYQLDNGHAYQQPNKIHADSDALARASEFGLTHLDIAKEEHAFVIMRHPTSRFLSLYFDKVVGSGLGGFKRLNRQLAKQRDFDADADTVLGHFKNCIALAKVLERGMSDAQYLPPNGHWAMQTTRLGVIKDCRLKVLLLEKLDAQMAILLRDIVPNIDAQLTSMKGKNKSAKLIDPKELMLPALIERIAEIYPRDQLHYDRAVSLWDGIEVKTATSADVPRLF